jgi:rhamnosyltransferase
VYTFFCSNSCAAYLNTALDEIGGFSPVLFGEDTVAVAKLLQNKHLIAYVAEAEVHHSHDYTLKQEFCRHFDIGYARLSYANLLESGGKDTKRGEDYVKALFNTLKKQHPELIPYALLQTLVKLLGYKCGQASLYAPLWLKRALSSQKYYWKNNP